MNDITSSSNYFNNVIGHIEDIVISEEFQNIQSNFFDTFYEEFDDTEENKIIYMDIFKNYTKTLETYIVNSLQDRMDNKFCMKRFAEELTNLRPQLDGEIFELLFSLTDFLAFKEMMLDYKRYKDGTGGDFNFEIVVKPIHIDDLDKI